eukprot:7057021-Pyramimonas_sp.AAC.1
MKGKMPDVSQARASRRPRQARRLAPGGGRAREAIKGMGGLRWAVQAQLVKRGGLKSGTRAVPKDVGGR